MKKQVIKYFILIAAVCAIFIGCTSGKKRMYNTNGVLNAVNGQNIDEGWTIFIYMCGSNLESIDGSAAADLQEMIVESENNNLRYIVETGGASYWTNSNISNDKIQRYEIKNAAVKLLDEQDNANMGNRDTLNQFVKWGLENYSSANMGFVFWNHGGGSIKGVCFDENYDFDSLSLQEIDYAFSSNITDKIDFVGFDACLMANLETAAIMSSYADYMIASEDSETGNGWDYTCIGEAVNMNKNVTAQELGKAICDSYYSACEKNNEEDMVTMSMIDLSKISKVYQALDDAAINMSDAVSDMSVFGNIAKGIKNAENYGGNTPDEGYTNMVDLGDMFNNISENVSTADEVLEAVDDAVIYNVTGRGRGFASGISIYYPLQVQDSEELSIFSDLCGSSNYAEFVNMMVYGSLNGTLENYDGSGSLEWSDENTSEDFMESGDSMVEIQKDIYQDDEGYYNIVINPDTLDYVESIQNVLMADWYGDGVYYYLGNDNNVVMDWKTGQVTDNFWGSWAALPDGQLLMLYVIEENKDYTIYSSPIRLNGKDTNLRFMYNYDTEEYEIIGTWDGINEYGAPAKDIHKLEISDVIEPYYLLYDSETGEDEDIYGEKYVVTEDFCIKDFILPDGDYYYCFEIVDIFGIKSYSDYGYYYVDENGEVYNS